VLFDTTMMLLGQARVAAPSAADRPDATTGRLASRRGARILLVEDNPSNQEVALGLIRESGLDADVGFIEGTQTHPRLAVRPWLTDELVVVAAPEHPLVGRPVALRELRGELADPAQFRRAAAALGATPEAAELWLLERVGSLNIEFELSSPEAIKRLVAAGAALGCLAREVVAQELAQGTLVELRTSLPRALRRLSIVLHRDKHVGRDTAEFIRHCGQLRSAGRGTALLTARRHAARP
jgi:DNA-binding transcriptional LysR family regulator